MLPSNGVCHSFPQVPTWTRQHLTTPSCRERPPLLSNGPMPQTPRAQTASTPPTTEKCPSSATSENGNTPRICNAHCAPLSRAPLRPRIPPPLRRKRPRALRGTTRATSAASAQHLRKRGRASTANPEARVCEASLGVRARKISGGAWGWRVTTLHRKHNLSSTGSNKYFARDAAHISAASLRSNAPPPMPTRVTCLKGASRGDARHNLGPTRTPVCAKKLTSGRNTQRNVEHAFATCLCDADRKMTPPHAGNSTHLSTEGHSSAQRRLDPDPVAVVGRVPTCLS